MKYIVTDKGPIDQHAPGADVTGVYRGDVLQRLIEDGYIAEDKPQASRKRKPEAVPNDTADEDGE